MNPRDIDTALTVAREQAAAWQANADLARAAGTTETLGWHIDRSDERDGIARKMFEAWQVIDGTMTGNLGVSRPEAWRVPPLTDEQYAKVVADWPELAIFGEDLVKDLTRHVGIRYVRWLARRAVKNVPALTAPAPHPVVDEDSCTCVINCDEGPQSGCSLSGRLHVHPRTRTGQYGPCPEHPDAPGDL
ncbi:hypothetical protein OG413_20615 [Streptomyces sp. NBC_01433]|uniref:hypothetical protein n=1 Tax=Streptomyces sp. NBC_01433 TaxID=2903864 RepID=UPI002255136D|nr:hypothetical protein [Streptomyces sp. NBC_01433]MCX4677678.1 hypothetical protein [Streptomyces sp. NBC_01433]